MVNVLKLLRGSQSKLSSQELGDLQKATHFDKKELQQWYKGKPKTCPYLNIEDRSGRSCSGLQNDTAGDASCIGTSLSAL